jgi:hypothetical protein
MALVPSLKLLNINLFILQCLMLFSKARKRDKSYPGQCSVSQHLHTPPPLFSTGILRRDSFEAFFDSKSGAIDTSFKPPQICDPNQPHQPT